MFKKIIDFLKSNKNKSGGVCIGGNGNLYYINATTSTGRITIGGTGRVTIGGDVNNSNVINATSSTGRIIINGKTYKGTHVVVNNLGVFVDGVKQKP